MDSFNNLLSSKGGLEGTAGASGENEMQALYYDLLACLAGGDHPNLPAGYEQKPMTGFCAILDAFNESNKIRQAGSGLIQEIGSKDTMSQFSSEALFSSSTQNMMDTTTSSADSDSTQCLIPPNLNLKMHSSTEDSAAGRRDISSAESHTDALFSDKPSESDLIPQSSSSSRETSAIEEQPDSQSDLFGVSMTLTEEATSQGEQVVIKDETSNDSNDAFLNYSSGCQKAIAEAREMMEKLKEDQRIFNDCSDNFEDAKDENQNWVLNLSNLDIGNEQATHKLDSNDSPKDDYQTLDGTESSSTTEVGSPQPVSQSSIHIPPKFPREIRDIELELSKYSEEIHELEKALKESLLPSPRQLCIDDDEDENAPLLISSETSLGSNNAKAACTTLLEDDDDSSHRLIAEGGLIKTFTDGMMDPMSALEMMYDAESIGSNSPCHPASTYLSTYQSCTSLASSQNANATLINSLLLKEAVEGVQRSNSFYMECINGEDDSDCSNLFPHDSSSVFPSHTNTESESILRESETGVGNVTKQNKLSVRIVDDRDANNDGNSEATYYSVNDATSEDEFHDCSDNDGNNNIAVASKASSKRRRRRKKNRGRKTSSSSSVSASEHLWTSASASEVDEERNKL